MASSKAKTTMNKMNRERKVRERRLEKEARKVARSQSPSEETAVDHRDYWLQGDETPEPPESPSES